MKIASIIAFNSHLERSEVGEQRRIQSDLIALKEIVVK